MKKVTTLALALFTSVAFAGVANAETTTPAAPAHHHAAHKANRIVERMTKELDLSADQQNKLTAIFNEEGEKVRAIHEQTRTRVDQVLTPEQQAKAKQMREERIKKWKEHRAEWKKEHSKDAK